MPSVLYIDAEIASASRMERSLRAAGYSTIRARSGLEGIELAQHFGPDLVAVASSIGDFDVHTLTLRLRSLPELRDKPIVVVDEGSDSQWALAVGATGTLPRNATPGALARGVANFLRGDRQSPDESSEIRLRALSERMAENVESQIRALQKANEELEYLARVRTELLRNLSHELATPITPAIGYVSMLRSEALGPLTSEQRVVIDAIANSLGRLEHVTSILRDVGALEKNEVRLRLSRFRIADFAQQFAESWQARGEYLTVVASSDGEVEGDTSMLSRALDRVVENARKFAGPAASIAVEFALEGDAARATVVDDGPGIPLDQIERVAEPFHQVDGSATRKHGGVGLGLAFAKKVAEAHGGSLSVESPPTREVAGLKLGGTEVTIRWLGRLEATLPNP